MATTLGISLPTLKNYCWYAEETYILQRITPFFRNIRSEISKAPSVYFSDLGFAFQNLVYLVLREKLGWSGARIHFWRTTAKTEIDFVIESGRRLVPVEVKCRELAKPALPWAVVRSVAPRIEMVATLAELAKVSMVKQARSDSGHFDRRLVFETLIADLIRVDARRPAQALAATLLEGLATLN